MTVTCGGQIGAPTAAQPQPCGEWTHRQHRGGEGKWTFHAGTASAPEGTEIDFVECCDGDGDPSYCDPARPAPAKQISWEGIGTFKNIHAPPDGELPENERAVAGVTFHWFDGHVEDLGEPGSHGSDDPAQCPLKGFNCSPGDCECPDFYRIRIFKAYDPESEEPNKDVVIYKVFGYLEGGNHQIHPPILGDHNCRGGGN